MTTSSRLVIDIGGTNARFARADESGCLDRLEQYRTADFATFDACLRAYLGANGGADGLSACLIAAAGPVDGDRVGLTNCDWRIDRGRVEAELAGPKVLLLNDLQAVAAALPHLDHNDLQPLAVVVASPPRHRTLLAFNVGTGCGAAIAVHCEGRWRTYPSEAGHMSLAIDDPAIARHLEPGSTVESVLAGTGLVALYRRIARDKGVAVPDIVDAAAVFARSAADEAARVAVDVFSTVLGRVSGDLVLATAAWGGVYFTGSVAMAWVQVGDAALWRRHFELKGAMSRRMHEVPAYCITRANVGLFGLAKLELAAGRDPA